MTWLFSGPQIDEVALRAEAVRCLAGRLPGYLDASELRAATARHGVALATAIAEQAFRDEPANAAFLARLAAPSQTRTGGIRIAVVPTMYHRERPEIGGDGALISAIAARLGLPVEVVPVASLGGIAANARTIAAVVRTWEAPRWVVSLSKGTADLKRALLVEPGLWERIAGWISLAGMPGGTPLAEARPGRPIAHALLRSWLALRGADGAMLREMGDSHPFSTAPLLPPASVPVVNVVPMPLPCHLRRPVDRSHAWLATMGPSDGYVLLEHALLPGRVIPLRGADHYLRTPEVAETVDMLLRWADGGAHGW